MIERMSGRVISVPENYVIQWFQETNSDKSKTDVIKRLVQIVATVKETIPNGQYKKLRSRS